MALEAFPNERVQRPDQDRDLLQEWLRAQLFARRMRDRSAPPPRYTDLETPGTENADPYAEYTDVETPGTVNSGSGSGRAAGAGGGLLWLGKKLGDTATDDVPDWIKALLGMAGGLPALFGNRGPSDEERAYQTQATRLLGQQEQRTQFQNPMFEALTKLAYGLQPNTATGGNPYPLNALSDVRVPGVEELIRAQRRTS